MKLRSCLIGIAPTLALSLSHWASAAEPIPNRDQLGVQIAALEKPAEQGKMLEQPLDAAKSALNRAHDARTAGDVEHGIELEALANDFVMMAKDMLHAAELEAALRKAQTELSKTEAARRQTETLLEATVAQRERTQAQLSQLRAEREAKKPTVSASRKPKKAIKGTKP